MSSHLLKKRALAASIAFAISSGVHAQNQDNDGSPIGASDEEVLVTGIRASLKRAMDIKREAQGVVDSISAEDIGKFPDTNLAESLQRITGVSISRNRGEGKDITVRGMGPDFNLVTLNGRQMPTSNLQGTTVNASRSFDFSNIASEGIAGVDVHKTSKAHISTGGVGATVNIKTTRPLDAPGLKFSVGTKLVYDESRLDPETTPEISGLYSQTFADDKIGVAVSLSHQEREGGFRQISVPNGWHTQSTQQVDGWFAGVALSSGELTEDDFITRPQNIEYNFTEFERDRTNGQLVLQFEPNERVRATLDYTYSEQEIASQNNTLNVWFWEGEALDEVNSEWELGSANNAGGNVFYPLVFSHFGGDDLVFGTADFAENHTNNSRGINIEWQVTDALTFELDYHNSDAVSRSASPYGNSSVIQTAAFVRSGAVVDFSQDFAVLGVRNPDGGILATSSAPASSLQPTGSSLRNSIFTNEIDQLQLKGRYEFDSSAIKSVDFGLAQTENAIRRGLMVAQRDNWGSDFGDPADLRDEVFEARTITGDFASASTTGQFANSDETFELFDLYYAFSFEDNAADIVATQAPINTGGSASTVWPCIDRFCVNEEWTTDQKTTEDMLSMYIQANFEFELGPTLLKATSGFRYEETDVRSSALVPAYTGIDWVADNEFSLVDTGENSSTRFLASYDNWLPNLDLSLEFSDNFVVRASYSETIARANYDSIAGGVTIGTLRNLNGDARRGDPTLLPHESTNYDLSFEWYFAEASYLSVGAFFKEVDNYVGSTTITENLFGLTNPSRGPRFDAATAALGDGADSAAIRAYIIANFPDSTTAPAAIHSLDEDPLYEFEVTIPINEESAEINGFEIAVQHTLASGFGGIINYTVVDSNREYDVTEFDSQFALPGLSDTLNLVGFFETDKLSFRLAYNWRDAFLTNQDRGQGNPEFVEEYSQWDANLSYEINDHFSTFIEGINITDETTRSYSRYEGMLQSATELGARYQLGARFTF